MKKVCQIDEEGYFVGTSFAEESPLEPGVYLYPSGSIDISEPVVPEGKRAKWDGSNWIIEDLPVKSEIVIPNKPHDGWVYNEKTNEWDPPVPKPGINYIWNGDVQEWQSFIEYQRNTTGLPSAEFKWSLLNLGLYDQVKEFVENGDNEYIRILWENSGLFPRTDSNVIYFMESLNFSVDTMDKIFNIETDFFDINSASSEDLQKVNGIGEYIANEIISGRPWKNLENLSRIKGVSDNMIIEWKIKLAV